MISIISYTAVHSVSELLVLLTKLIMDPSVTSNGVSKLSCFLGLSLVREPYILESRTFL